MVAEIFHIQLVSMHMYTRSKKIPLLISALAGSKNVFYTLWLCVKSFLRLSYSCFFFNQPFFVVVSISSSNFGRNRRAWWRGDHRTTSLPRSPDVVELCSRNFWSTWAMVDIAGKVDMIIKDDSLNTINKNPSGFGVYFLRIIYLNCFKVIIR